MSDKEPKSGIVLTTSGKRAAAVGLVAAGAIFSSGVHNIKEVSRIAGSGAEAAPGLVVSGAETVADAAKGAGAATDRFIAGGQERVSEYNSVTAGAKPDGSDLEGLMVYQARGSGDSIGDPDAPPLVVPADQDHGVVTGQAETNEPVAGATPNKIG